MTKAHVIQEIDLHSPLDQQYSICGVDGERVEVGQHRSLEAAWNAHRGSNSLPSWLKQDDWLQRPAAGRPWEPDNVDYAWTLMERLLEERARWRRLSLTIHPEEEEDDDE